METFDTTSIDATLRHRLFQPRLSHPLKKLSIGRSRSKAPPASELSDFDDDLTSRYIDHTYFCFLIIFPYLTVAGGTSDYSTMNGGTVLMVKHEGTESKERGTETALADTDSPMYMPTSWTIPVSYHFSSTVQPAMYVSDSLF